MTGMLFLHQEEAAMGCLVSDLAGPAIEFVRFLRVR
jgi:hypothetical protein